jgi:hypothetical protein
VVLVRHVAAAGTTKTSLRCGAVPVDRHVRVRAVPRSGPVAHGKVGRKRPSATQLTKMFVGTKQYHDFDDEIKNHHDQTKHVAAVVGVIVVETHALVDAHLDEIKQERHGDQQDEIKDRAALVEVGDGDAEGGENGLWAAVVWVGKGGTPGRTCRERNKEREREG